MKRMPSLVAAKQLLQHGPGDLFQAQDKGSRIEGAVGYRDGTAHRYWPMPRKR